MKTINTICICGGGTMGNGIAQVFAQYGFDTILFDISGRVLDNAKATINNNSIKSLIATPKGFVG